MPSRGGQVPSSQGSPRGERDNILFSSRDTSHSFHYTQAERLARRHIYRTPATVYRNFYNPVPHGHSTRQLQAGSYFDSQPHYALVLAPPPPIAEEESILLRAERVALSRARCGHFTLFPTYTYRIGLTRNQCTTCGSSQGCPLHGLTQCSIIQNTRRTNNFLALEHLWSRHASSSAGLKEAATLHGLK